MKSKKNILKKSPKLSLESLTFPDYAKVRKEIEKKLGVRPAKPTDLPEGCWTEQALKVLTERYLRKDGEGKTTETPDELCWRVAWEIASSEILWGKKKEEVLEIAKDYFKLLASHEFLPNSPTLMNAGVSDNLKYKLQYSGCFVVPVEDSLIGIFDAIKYQALIHQTGGGTGFSFNRLRPRGSIVGSSMGVASGPVSFMRIFDAATNEIKQGGKRRGANMGILRVDHPDILEFIHCKEGGGITNFNISVAITDKFMEAYKKGENYDLIDPRHQNKVGELSAREVFDEIAQQAWKTGDPGLVFIDRINRGSSNPVPSLGPIESTNPCGEQPLYPFDSCNLGSIFLTYFVKGEEGKKEVDWEKLGEVTRKAVRFLDSVIELNPYSLEQIRRTTLAIRRIGLGVGGWADMLIEMGLPYDSEEALALAEKVMKFVQNEATLETEELAISRGPFPLWPTSIYRNGKPRRNSTVTTIAPTGTISIIAGASSGIEPMFALAYQHIVKDKHLDRKMSFINPMFEEIAMKKGFWSEQIRQKVAEKGIIREISEIPQEVRDIFGTAHEIDPEWHIKAQAAFQKYTDNAVSKTINLRHEVKVEEVKRAYLLAWETSCKGVTVFRDGCKEMQVLNLGLNDKKEREAQAEGKPLVERPYKVNGSTYKMATPMGTAFVTINETEEGEPLEVFINIGKAGSDLSAVAEALGRTISTSLRFRGSLSPRERAKEIAHQLSGIGGRHWVGFGPNRIRSLPDAIAAVISSHYGFAINGNGHPLPNSSHPNEQAGANLVATAQPASNGVESSNGVLKSDPTSAPAGLNHDEANGVTLFSAKDKESNLSGETYLLGEMEKVADICPSCGASALVFQEGCAKCYACGHSEC